MSRDRTEQGGNHAVRRNLRHYEKSERKLFGGRTLKKNHNGKLKIIPLGGLEQIGMNITAFEYEDSIVVVDCGLSFPENDMLGIDLRITEVTSPNVNIETLKGLVFTHGHEDHILALPSVLKEVTFPLYATDIYVGCTDNTLTDNNLHRT